MRLFSVLFTVFLDYLGVGLVFPFFFPMIMDPAYGFLSLETSQEMRGLFVGMLISAYSVAQFCSLPILGAWSDRVGRKKVLVLSLVVVCIGFIMGIIGVFAQSVALLFLSRILDGLGAGNYAVAQAALSDVAREGDKTKLFGLLNMACGSGFIIGPFVGGLLADVSLFGYPAFATPFFAAFLLGVFNTLLVKTRFVETATVLKKTKVSLFKGLVNFQKAFTLPRLRVVFAMMFVFSFGWGFLVEFFPLFLMKAYKYGPEEIGFFYAYIGALMALFQGFAIRPFVKRYTPKRLLMAGLLLLGLSTPIIFSVDTTPLLLLVLLPIMFFEALVYPSASTVVSDLSGNDEQGGNLGIHQSMQAAGIALAPLFSGSLVALYPYLPIAVGAIASIASWLILVTFKVPQALPDLDDQQP